MIHIGHISTLDRIRSLDQKQVGALAESIKEVGLLNPITVYRKTIIYAGQEIDGFGLIAGAHRLAACKTLGMQEIPAVILDLDDNDRVIAECDENLCAAKLSPSDAALFTAERKRAYLAKHPETAHGGNLEGAGVAKFATPEVRRFTADTAAKTGKSERKVQLDAERGADIDEAALRLVRGTSLDTGLSPPRPRDVRLLCKRRLFRRDIGLRRVQDHARFNAQLAQTIEQVRETLRH
jgi:hypothetical protein